MSQEARAAADHAARASYGRLLAIIAGRSRDISAAEDALSEAFAAALETWPVRGVPDNPDAWLLTAARRKLGHDHRHLKVRAAAASTIELLHDEMQTKPASGFPDERLKLLFVCAHPAIDEGVRTPLMLQVVLGLDAATIASAFLTAPAAMGQRLSRAKSKIRDAHIGFQVPTQNDLTPRLSAVLAAIYAAYGTGWDDAPGVEAKYKGLADEAIFLGRLVVTLLPDEPEARGLLALMLYCQSRLSARRAANGAFVALMEQDANLWSQAMIVEAERELTQAAKAKVFGRFQVEAAIQSVHAQRAITGVTQWPALILLYDLLAARSPTIGALIARAATYGQAQGADVGLALLDELSNDDVAAYQPYWATRAHLLAQAQRTEEAYAAYTRAIGLSEHDAIKAFLIGRRALAPAGL